MIQPRELSLKILYDVEKNGAYLNISYQNYTESSGLSGRDAALVKELTYGVLKHKLTLDETIACYSSVKLKKIAPYVLCILRMGLYQLFFMDKIPDRASVDESVKLAGKYAGKSRGFVNAILRKAQAEGLVLPEGKTPEALSVRYSHPAQLVEWLSSRFGEEKAEHLMIENNRTPALCIRVNRLKTEPQALQKMLAQEGVTTRPGKLSCDALLIDSGNISRLDAFEEGLFTVQDQSAQLAALALAPKPGETVFDVCAAPGGKTTHLAELMENRGQILALDIYEKRLLSVEKTAQRLGITIIKTQVADGATYKFPMMADKILVDAPCSGLGVIRRRPDIKYKPELTSFGELVRIQRDILENAAQYLKPGGVMVYSTCTINPEENEEQVKAFLEKHEAFELLPVDYPGITEEASKLLETGMGTVYPEGDSGDGFFIAKLRRRNSFD